MSIVGQLYHSMLLDVLNFQNVSRTEEDPRVEMFWKLKKVQHRAMINLTNDRHNDIIICHLQL